MKPTARGIAVLTAALLPAPAILALHFRDGPPARVTGGFGEDSCTACHFDHAANDGTGKLALTGLPERYVPGETYPLELALTRPGMKGAGFQLAVRHTGDRTQAGRIELGDDEEPPVERLEERGVTFASHSRPAKPAAGEAAVRWKLLWTAPDDGAAVSLHAAAVAADGDESQAGDFVYTLEVTSTE